MYRILHPTNIEQAWPAIEPWLRDAVDDTTAEVDLAQIKQDARAGASLVIVGYDPKSLEMDLALVCECRRLGGMLTLVIMWAAGKNMRDWIHDISIIENIARDRGFVQLQIWGRKGFEKMLKSEGYRHEFTVIGKPLHYGVN